MDYTQPPAIIERFEDVGRDCGYLHHAGLNQIRYIFDIDLEEAVKVFPTKTGLERLATIQNRHMGNAVLFALYKYRDSRNPWDIAVEYNKSTGKPITLRLSKGRIYYLVDKEVHIPHQHDIVFNFKESAYGFDGEFDFEGLKTHIKNAYYACNAGERQLLEEEFSRIKENEKQKRTPAIEDYPKIKKQNSKPQIRLRQK